MSTRSIKTKFQSATGLLCLDAYILACGGLMLGLSFLCVMGPQVWPDEDASAVGSTQSELSVNAASTLDYSLSISSSSNINMDLAPNLNGAYASAVDHVRVTTDAVGGYQLYLNTASSETSLKDPSSNLASIIPTNGTVTDPAPLGLNSWGFAISSTADNITNTNFDPTYNTPEPSADSTWAAVPATQQLISTSSNPTPTAGDNLDVYYGVYLNAVIPAGQYSNTVVYSALADISPDATTASIFPTTGNYHEETKLNIAAPLAAGTGDISDVKITFAGQLTNASHICSDIQYRTTTDTLWATCTVPHFVTWDKYDVSVQVSADIDQSYTADSNFTILKNNSAPTAATPLANGMYMQEITPTMCTATPKYSVSSTTYTLIDGRDSLGYQVRKLQDGNCWMVSNLRLTGPLDLSPGNTDIEDSWRLPSSSNIGETWENNNTPHIISGNAALNYNNTTDAANGATWQPSLGNYYSWGAATADTAQYATHANDEAAGSICPKGWRLPSNTGTRSYVNLGYSYGATVVVKTNDATFPSVLRSTPLDFSYPGYYKFMDGIVSNLGVHGHWWMSTAETETTAYLLFSDSNSYHLQGHDRRGLGFSIRCVAR